MSFVAFLRVNAAWLTAGFLLTFTSSFGQTFFISIFAGEIRETFGLSHGQWGGLYTIATTGSAVLMVWSGVLTDRYRVRSLGAVVLSGLALAALAMALVPNAWLLVVVIFALRFTGQGMTNHLAVVAMARWFTATRGKALAIARLGFTLGEALLPMAFVALLALYDWRWLWVIAAGAAVLAIPLLSLLLQRERIPSEMSASSDATGMQGRHWTRGEVLRHPLFWFVVPLLIGPPAFGTALFFHQVHLAEVKGWPLLQYVALFPVYSGVSLVFMLISGWAVDRFGTARLMPWILLPMAIGFFLMGRADTLAAAALAFALLGITSGSTGTVPSAFWAEFYGTRHIGSIKALASALMVFGSAIGPGLTGLLIDLGFPFPAQMMAISVYFIAAAGLIAFGVRSISAN
ncbi:MFS transporter [Sinisalibacter aestuarii]|uniref:MFS transporter n=1 Tax=Sinisalibacter aestuarii TaxID=2949426 RepID=A0ABQ5LNA6_9RHOB|nr:MFS transporter [Sinisalibacter aestuarii]GKY86438.1 MFS transporter [Sinisalibacter aestuarii]